MTRPRSGTKEGIMAVEFTPTPDHGKDTHVIGDLVLLIGTLEFSGSYATGGDLLDSIQARLKKHGAGHVFAVLGGARGHTLEYDDTTGKLKVFSSANTELAAAAYNAALTGDPVPVAFLGR